MDHQPPLYERDILAWSEQQAKVLRRLRAVRGLPAELDLDNVAEEIESVGRSQREAVESLLLQLLLHLAKIVLEPDSLSLGHWRGEAILFQAQARRRYTPSMAQRIDMQDLWRDVVRALAAQGDAQRALVARMRDAGCPLTLGQLTHDDFDLDAAVKAMSGALDG